MFPHDKLDWTLSRLERALHDTGDLDTRLEFVRASLSRGRFHGGGAADHNAALTGARRILHQEPGHPEALALASLALVLLDRAEAAERYLDEARRTAAHLPVLHMALGEVATQAGDHEAAFAAYSQMVHLSPDSWEAHLLMGTWLAARVHEDEAPTRWVEKAMYHLVRTLQLGPSPEEEPTVLRDLARLSLLSERYTDAETLFTKLQRHPRFRAEARFYLGRVAGNAGKYKKAIMYFRQYLGDRKDDSHEAWTRIGSAYLHLGEPIRAREACNRALALEPGNLEARWILGSSLVEEGALDEAVRAFRDLLEAAPDHHRAFAELVRLRTLNDDIQWLRRALRTETAVYDRLPQQVWQTDGRHGTVREIHPRQSTRQRIDVLVKAICRADKQATSTVLDCLHLTTDEGLRFQLWEGVLELMARVKAQEATEQLLAPGDHYSSANGRAVLSVSHLLDEAALTQGLTIGEEDLRKAAVDRHGPATDVVQHRERVAQERLQARAWQAMLLLAIATKDSATARNLLVRWAADADDELSTAARAGLALMGDADALQELRSLTTPLNLDHLVMQMERITKGRPALDVAELVKERDDLTCATCGRRGSQVSHMLTNHRLSVCNVCLQTINQRRRELRTRDPQVTCSLTGATLLDTPALYVYQGIPVSQDCLEKSLGHEEREVIASYLASL